MGGGTGLIIITGGVGTHRHLMVHEGRETAGCDCKGEGEAVAKTSENET